MILGLCSLLVGHVVYMATQVAYRWAGPIAQNIGEHFVRVAAALHFWRWAKWLAQAGSSLARWASLGSRVKPSHDRIGIAGI